ncbi:DNA polymerase III, subunit gamma and tau [Rubrobacter radiotolerans]|uniref:DNA polymerase III subunit gamma/tau n=1 Tax=Rubrobacter radiotolerans TaxID=42256 RepID=A0A023WZT8_RUBRA|nr:DNA polymerase III subunit gamma/tau [Rubrobacter radiotolerans]AHY45747.1 DNA polymerase III, subunit gamma and tau [Rubrobacter radiotolerans]MDX5893163.1 DNA polymerase III subunit gamma/tau [Rubrobacter radiotolerans]SMC03189.1 DNA polymerase-3 subunit gamma/tau [Rubrobacter radiotolerans DSM 5868]
MRRAALYRKWRPRKFAEISGQEAVVRTLRRAIETDRVAHAYLFSGPRGTGKTSSAKVLAMGLNCRKSDGPTPEPCGECESCRAVINNSSLDVVEMDAASNRGIDEIRDLRDRVNLAPAAGRSKVYIIDEVHMLTTEAFNALLKMLEEPPEHAVFILATTEKHKVLPTIVSRCQSFEFRRPGIDVLAGKLGEIAAAEGIAVEDAALTLIARAGGGSFRDAEGLLDQLSSFSEGEVTAAQVRELLGSAGPETLIETTDALAERRVADSLRVLERLSNEGRDLGRFARELTGHLRNLMLLPHAPEVALAEVGADEREALREQAERLPTAEAARTIDALGEAAGRIRRGGDAKLELELCFMKLARDYAEPSVEALLSRVETLEAALRNGSAVPPAHSPVRTSEPSEVAREAPETATPPEPPVSGRDEPPAREPTVPERPASPSQEEPERREPDLAAEWPGVIQELKRRKKALSAAVYGEARDVRFGGGSLAIVFPPQTSPSVVKMARDKTHTANLKKVLEESFGVAPRIEVRSGGEKPADAQGPEAGAHAAPLDDEEPPPEENPPPEAAAFRPVPGARAEGVRTDEARAPEAPPVSESRAGAEGGGGIIRDQREVFGLARDFFGRPHDGGR